MLLLASIYLLVGIIVPVALYAAAGYRRIHEGYGCPLCQTPTLWVVLDWLHFLRRLRVLRSLQQRWCPQCGWEGLTRASAVPVEELSEAPVEPATAAGRSAEVRVQTFQLRQLDVQGRSWRVLLKCWTEAEVWYGRLLFMAPSGRLWVDATRPFAARSRGEVVGQALALPNPTLAGRLRQVASESL